MSSTISQHTNVDEVAINTLIQAMVDAWNRGDGSAYGALFAEDANFTVWNGMRIQGREAIAIGHQQIFDTMYCGSRLELVVQQLRFLRPDLALAHVDGQLWFTDGRLSNSTRPLFVLTKSAGIWQIDAFQNTPLVLMPTQEVTEE